MKVTASQVLTQFSHLLQTELFPTIESAVGPLSKQGALLVSVIGLTSPQLWVSRRRASIGRQPQDRQCLAKAFLAKAVYNLAHTRHLIGRLHSDVQLRRLCGWQRADQVPSEATFSRAFAEFAVSGLPSRMHEALVRGTQQNCIINYIARDSTAIEARQHLPGDQDSKPKTKHNGHKPAPTKKTKTTKKYRPRRKPGPFPRAKASERGPRLQRQQLMTLDQMLADLPQECSIGVKTNSQGHQHYWRGYKLHWDVADSGRIPISCILTGASVHDSQVAIPLMKMSAERVKWRCDVMDSAYDANAIRKYSEKLRHEALIKPVKRKRTKSTATDELSEEDKQRFKKRTIVEQLNARLKDEFGGRMIYFRGAAKILAHLMFGVLALTVDQLLRTVG